MRIDHRAWMGGEIATLLETMVARREKIFRSVPVVGQDIAKKNYADVVIVVDAIKIVIGRMVLP